MCFDGVKRLCHQGQTQEEGLDQSIRHCPYRPQGLSGRQGRRDPEVLGRRGEEPKVLRRVPRVRQDQRDRRVWRRRRR